jgi:flagellar hook protein FlgE
MLDVMNQAKNAIEAYNVALKATSSNIANMNVPGYKRVDVSFQSVFERVLTCGTAGNDYQGGTNPRQLGQGMALSDVALDFTAGEFVAGASLDLAISGQGMFVVSPDAGATYLYTRSGKFDIDANGNLLSNGMQVYGLDASGNVVPISNLPSGAATNYRWQADGTLQYSPDGVNFTSTGYRIALTYFTNPGGLAQAQGTAFAETVASGAAATFQGPGDGVGSLKTGQLEQSNVFYLGETINAMELQRAMTGNLTILRMASDLISSFISKLS